MTEYNVIVNDKPYLVTIKQKVAHSVECSYDASDLSVQSTKTEYDHCVERSERLDNKIYIILTVFAFLFVLLCDVIKNIQSYKFPDTNEQLALIIIYSILLALDIGLYTYTLVKLTHLLKGVSIRRFTPQVILERNMIDSNPKAVAKYLCSRYNQCIDTNNELLENRFKKFNICVNCMIPIVLISIFLIFISNFIQVKGV